MAGVDAGVLDHVDLDRTFRLSARLDGVPEEILRPQNAVNRLRRKRAEEIATAQQQAQTQQPMS